MSGGQRGVLWQEWRERKSQKRKKLHRGHRGKSRPDRIGTGAEHRGEGDQRVANGEPNSGAEVQVMVEGEGGGQQPRGTFAKSGK